MTDSTSGALRFHEIEHKFVVDDAFDLEAFGAKLEALGPIRKTSIRVRDTYYVLHAGRSRDFGREAAADGDAVASPRFVIRHRYDDELHHLTLKSVEADTQVRREINLDLGHHAGDQSARVEAFLETLGVAWRGSLHKDLRVWYFPDAEVVHYRATTGERCVCCVEFEATRKPSLPEALEVLERYEQATGFDAGTRSDRSLVQMLFPEMQFGEPVTG